ncbi:MAG: cellulase family glycosylhydrolase [Prevotellaceae bacterium]|nr:cellulase family glycosylhydrolase [Candidatus Minthosoma equi]
MKKTINIMSLIIALFATLAFQGCKSDDVVASATYLEIYRADIDAKVTELDFNLGSAFMLLGVHCDADWDAECDADWCTISNHAGYGYVDPNDSTKRQSYLKLNVSKNMGDPRTARITFTSGNSTAVLVVNQKGAAADPGDTFETAYEFVENIHMGYNLGNTLDSDPQIGSYFRPKSHLDYETAWGQPVTTQEIIDSIAAKGFNVIRIPVTWFPHMGKTWECNEVWMNRVQEVVDYVLNAGCYCILNVQHDTGARGTRTDGAGWLRADMEEYENGSAEKFKSLWTQIATRFKDYDEKLIFEAFNEILDKEDTWGDPKDKDAYRAITLLEQDFVDAVRATGGNNEFRNLLVNTYGSGSTQEKLDNFQVPQDKHSNHILASVHSYDPYNFCCDNGEYNVFVWSSDCEQEINAIAERVNKRFNDLGVPYIYGEFGAIDEGKDMGERIKYAKYAMSKFKSYETTGLWWMGLLDRKTLKWYEDEIVDALSNNCK